MVAAVAGTNTFPAGTIVIGSTPTSGGTNTFFLYDNNGVVGETSSLPAAVFANPTASIGLAAVNGSAITAMRSDAAPALASTISAGGPTGSSSLIPVITYNAAGQLTAVTTASISVPTAANPTASVGLTAVNGVATTFMRSDGAPALDVTAAFAFSGLGNTTLGGTSVLKVPSGSVSAPSIAFSADPTTGFYHSTNDAINFAASGVNAGVFNASGYRLLNTLTFAWSTNPGVTTPQLFLSNPAAATLQHGAADVASGAVAQTVTFQGNTGASTTGPLALIKGALGGSGAASVGGELRLQGGLSGAAAGTGGAVTFYTAPSGAGATAALALTIGPGSSAVGPQLAVGGAALSDGYTLNVLGTTGNGNVLKIANQGASTHTLFDFYNANANPAAFRSIFSAYQSRGTLASPTALSSGDTIFSVLANGYDGSGYQFKASLDFVVDGSVSAGVVPTSIVFKTSSSSSARAAVLTIASSGAVSLASVTDSSTPTTGSLITAGGIGAAKSITAGNGFNLTGTYLQLKTAGGTLTSFLESPTDGNIILEGSAGGTFGRLQFGGTSASFPALKRSTTILQARLADDSAYAPFEANTLRTATAYTVATLPAAGSAGRIAYVTDALTPAFLVIVVGGGSVVSPVFDNGTNWVAF